MADTTPIEFLTAILAGFAVSVLWRVLHQRKCRFCAMNVDFNRDPRPVPWYGDFLLATLIVLWGIASGFSKPSIATCVILPVGLVFCIFRFVRTIIRQRPQFTLANLFAVTTLVACVCSACHYIPAAPLVAFIFFPP
jgi:hypothetical protein